MMKFAFGVCAALVMSSSVEASDHLLWYQSPASQTPWKIIHRNQDWRRHCLPIGNGSLGGMIFGNPDQERVQFNEDTFWIGDEDEVGNSMPFADVYVKMPHEQYTNYRRELNIAKAIHTISYTCGGVNYTRQYFSSRPDRVMVLHFTADKPGSYSGELFMDDLYEDSETELSGNRITLAGDDAGASPTPGGRGGATIEAYSLRKCKYKKRFDVRLAREAQLRVLHKGGTVRIEGKKFILENVDEFTVLVAAGTDFVNQRSEGWRGEHPHVRITADLDAASARSFDDLLGRHVADYRKLYDRFDIDLGKTAPAQAALPTDERLTAAEAGTADPQLQALIYQYARYLMISCSRPGTMPSHLQGIWNRSTRPAWWGDFHTDVNIQMCYWFVDKANLSECYEPYVSWLNSIRQTRTEHSRIKFKVRGWTFGAMNNPYGGSAYFNVKGTAAWCAQNLFDHYRFTQDKKLLQEQVYPILRELCWFWEDLLKTLPDGTLVSTDGFSPEHGPDHVDGVSFDQQLIWDLFTNTIEATEDLGIDEQWRQSLRDKRERLLGPQIGRWGQLQEWMEDIDDPKSTHRHLSHLIALHPGRQISPSTTPKIAKAAEVSLEARGEGRSAWSKVWRAIMWARLHNAERAYGQLELKLRKGHFNDNLFSCHDPNKAFQIDGNFGWAEAVSEMIVQSHLPSAGTGRGYLIQLLPALPKAWSDGRVRGLRVRGGYALDMQWTQGKVSKSTLRAVVDSPREVNVEYGTKRVMVKLNRGESIDLDWDAD